MVDKVTQEMIQEGMARAEKVACRPGDDRCYSLPYDVESAQQTCTAKGRSKVGRIVAKSGRERWDVWRDRHTGEGSAFPPPRPEPRHPLHTCPALPARPLAPHPSSALLEAGEAQGLRTASKRFIRPVPGSGVALVDDANVA